MAKPVVIYMNEHIRDDKPRKPVIVVEGGGLRRKLTNYVEIVDLWGVVVATVRYDPPKNPSKTHQVKAWIEVYDRHHVRIPK